jgi:mannose-6-phosphate isomerase-like protein (cupin superfamily)
MRVGAILAVLGATLVPSEAIAITTYSTSPFHRIIAEATAPDRRNAPLYFSVWYGIVRTDKTQEVSFGDGFYYQYFGKAKITIEKETVILQAGDGIFTPAGTRFTLRADGTGELPTYMQFLLLPAPEARSTDQPTGTSVEVYRSPSPIPSLMQVRNQLSLSRVPVPPEAPCDPLHQRSGAALHYILSGAGAEFTETRATTRGPGSISYEPRGFAYQWSNPGSKPLIYLVFNVSPQGLPPVVEVDDDPADPFASNSHITWAIYCVALAMILTLIVYGAMVIEHNHEIGAGDHHDKRRKK